jgi:hypothetical protein
MATISITSNEGKLSSASAVLEVSQVNAEARPPSGSMIHPTSSLSRPIGIPAGNHGIHLDRTTGAMAQQDIALHFRAMNKGRMVDRR